MFPYTKLNYKLCPKAIKKITKIVQNSDTSIGVFMGRAYSVDLDGSVWVNVMIAREVVSNKWTDEDYGLS